MSYFLLLLLLFVAAAKWMEQTYSVEAVDDPGLDPWGAGGVEMKQASFVDWLQQQEGGREKGHVQWEWCSPNHKAAISVVGAVLQLR